MPEAGFRECCGAEVAPGSSGILTAAALCLHSSSHHHAACLLPCAVPCCSDRLKEQGWEAGEVESTLGLLSEFEAKCLAGDADATPEECQRVGTLPTVHVHACLAWLNRLQAMPAAVRPLPRCPAAPYPQLCTEVREWLCKAYNQGGAELVLEPYSLPASLLEAQEGTGARAWSGERRRAGWASACVAQRLLCRAMAALVAPSSAACPSLQPTCSTYAPCSAASSSGRLQAMRQRRLRRQRLRRHRAWCSCRAARAATWPRSHGTAACGTPGPPCPSGST